MQEDGLFRWLGNALGEILRAIVEAIGFIFSRLGSAVHEFFAGLAGAMGMDPSVWNIVWIVLGVWMLFSAIRAFARRAVVAGVIWLLLVMVLFGLLMSEPARVTQAPARTSSAAVLQDHGR